MGRIKTPKVVAPVEALEHPAEVLFVLRVNTSLIRVISHASLFWLVLFTNVLSLKVNISQSVVWTGKRRGYYKLDGVQKLPNKPKLFPQNQWINRHCWFCDDVLHHRFNDNFDAFSTLLSFLKKGIFVDRKPLLMQKTNSELRGMLIGIDKISKLNKKQLVDLVIEKNELFWY